MIDLDKEEVMCNVLQSPILVRSVQAKELFRDVSTEGLDRVRCRAIDKELVRDARRASDKGLVQDARRASDKGLVQGARRASDKGLVQGARRASDKGLVQGARRAIAKVLRQVAKRASAGELSKDAMQNLKCANAKDEPAKSKGAGKTIQVEPRGTLRPSGYNKRNPGVTEDTDFWNGNRLENLHNAKREMLALLTERTS